MKNSPPRFFLRFFRWYCHPRLRDHIEGDLIEVYNERLRAYGRRKANRNFIVDVLLLFRPGIIKPINASQSVNTYGMYKSYLKISWRNLLRSKGYSLINIGGLATGMSVAILIGLWVHDEVSYDRNFINYDRIARVAQNQTFDGEIQTWQSQAMQLGPELRENYGHNFEYVVNGTFQNDFKLGLGEKTVTKSGSYMDPGIAEMLTLNMVDGTRSGLKDMNSIMLSRSAATALFGDDDAMNKVIRIDNNVDVNVTGVYEDLPANSSFSYLHVILPFELLVQTADLKNRVGWGNSWFQCLVQISAQTNMQSVSANIKDAKLKRVLVEDDDARLKPELFLHPMNRWRLHSEFENGVSLGGRIQYVWIMATIGAFVLLLACINFMNLSTARSEKRAKEVGIRKTIGSVRTQLVQQFFTESLLVAGIAFVLAMVIVELALPWFNQVSDKRITLLWKDPVFWTACGSFAVATGLIAGSYPALFLSSLKPISVLKGTFKAGRFSTLPRKALVVVQFTVSVSLIIGTLVIFRQIQFAQNRPVGYNINGIVTTPIKTPEIMKHFEAFRDQLLKTGAVGEIAASEASITATYTTNSGFEWQGKPPGMNEEFVTSGVTHDFGKVIGWEVIRGHDFSKELASDSSGFIINEAAARYLGFANPIGETIKWGDNGEWKIIGVVRDMITQSPFSKVKPMIFFLRSNKLLWIKLNNMNMKLNPELSALEALTRIEPVFKRYDPENPFEYRFADQEFGKKFGEERRMGNLTFIVATLAIFISCLGLFGLAAFVAGQRVREIGIRKVLGASVSQIWNLLSQEFVVLVAISCVVAMPLSFYCMSDWLSQYDYRVAISWEILALTDTGALFITFMTISYHALKAATMNPVNSLRSE